MKQTSGTTQRSAPGPGTGVPTVELGSMEGGRSRHSPRSIEAANITTVVTMVTSKLSRTLTKATRLKVRMDLRCRPCDRLHGSPDELGFGLDVSHTILGQGLVDTVEECPQKPARHSHHDEEGEVDGRPQVAALVPVWTLTKDSSRVKVLAGTR